MIATAHARHLGLAAVSLALAVFTPGCRCAAFLHSLEEDYGCTTSADCSGGRVCVMHPETGEGLCVLTSGDAGVDGGGTDTGTDAGDCSPAAPCDDGDPCTVADACDGAGACIGGVPVDCTALDGDCTIGSCDPGSGGCIATPINEGGSCNDGQYCTDPDVCTAGTCGGGARNCADPNACTVDSCDESVDVCLHDSVPLEGNLCDDGLFCTVNETCQVGVCTGGASNSCADLEGCTTDTCNEATNACVNMPVADGTVCASAGGCLTGGTCAAGVCSAVTPAPMSTPCDDADYCTGTDECDGAGSCVGSDPVVCQDFNGCTNNVCSPASGCSFPAVMDGSSCDDGQFCTTGEVCTTGVCGGGGGTDCSAVANQCNGAGCNEVLNACMSVPVPPGTPCTDGLFCNVGEVCTAGVCGGGAANPCPDGNQCTSDTCDEIADACVNPPVADGAICADGLFCTDGEVCTGGSCGGGSTPCADGDLCTIDVCDESGDMCSYPAEVDGAPCEDGISCTSPDSCVMGGCASGPEIDALCLAGDLCRVACFGGCGTPPASLTVTCPSPTLLVAGSGTSSCDVDLDGVPGQAGCLTCSASSGIETLAFSDFATCTTDGWTATGGAVECPPPFGGDAIAAESSTSTLERTFVTTGLDQVWLCFDYADQGATGSDFLRVEMFGGSCAFTFQIMEEYGGPHIGATDDGVYFSYCIDLDARSSCAANNAALTLRFSAQSFGSGRWLAFDNVWVGGATNACLTMSDALFQSAWVCPGGSAVTGWTVEMGTPICNVLPDEIRADNNTWQMRRCVDVSAYDSDVYVDFLYGETNADEGGTAEGIDLYYNVGCDAACTCPAGSWTRFFTHQSNILSTTTNVRRFFANLSALDPAVDGHPSLGLRVAMSAGGGGRQVRLDDFRVGGLVMMCTPADVTVGPPLESGGGYTVDATSTSAQVIQIECSWDAPPVPVEDATSVSYFP